MIILGVNRRERYKGHGYRRNYLSEAEVGTAAARVGNCMFNPTVKNQTKAPTTSALGDTYETTFSNANDTMWVFGGGYGGALQQLEKLQLSVVILVAILCTGCSAGIEKNVAGSAANAGKLIQWPKPMRRSPRGVRRLALRTTKASRKAKQL